jgi:hypothetical protein
MKTIEINSEARNSRELADTLRKIARYIDEGYWGGITDNGTTWGIDGEDEEEDYE